MQESYETRQCDVWNFEAVGAKLIRLKALTFFVSDMENNNMIYWTSIDTIIIRIFFSVYQRYTTDKI
jgi:hypothetical protein